MNGNQCGPAQAWKALREGNQRFAAGIPQRPGQGFAHRAQLVSGQNPQAVLFGCADSRVAAEIIFDQGLGDMFIVRTGGQVIDSAVLGSIEYAVTKLGVPLIAILGHDACVAVGATLQALDTGELPGGYIRDMVVRVMPTILAGRKDGLTSIDQFEARHVQDTATNLLQHSHVIAEAVHAGTLAIVCLTYTLADGCVTLHSHIGDIGQP